MLGPGDDGGGERVLACARTCASEAGHRFCDGLLCRHRVVRQVGDDEIDGHRVVTWMPTVVVGHERESGVADLRFSGELGFLQVRHADDVHAPLPIESRLGERGELRTFHVHVGPSAVHGGANGLRAVTRDLCEVAADRMREPDVRNQAAAEERADAAIGPIEELIGHEDIEGTVLFLQAANGTCGQDALDAKHLEAVDVRAKVQLGRRDAVPCAVPREEGHARAAKRGEHVGTGRFAKRRLDDAFFAVGQFGHVVQAAAANDANRRVAHVRGRRPSLPSCSVMNAAGMAGSCSKKIMLSRRPTSRAKACLAKSVSIG